MAPSCKRYRRKWNSSGGTAAVLLRTSVKGAPNSRVNGENPECRVPRPRSPNSGLGLFLFCAPPPVHLEASIGHSGVRSRGLVQQGQKRGENMHRFLQGLEVEPRKSDVCPDSLQVTLGPRRPRLGVGHGHGLRHICGRELSPLIHHIKP